jgi:hypothetical protein
MPDVPSRLLRQGRPADPDFLPSELLFRRIHPRQFLEGRVDETSLESPDFSVNREKYSVPGDVVAQHAGFGICAFRVRDIPPRIQSGDGRVFTFPVEHVPEEDNYSHSEVRTYCDGERVLKPKKAPNTVRTEFRILLFKDNKVVLLRSPTVL